ncbi:hypothetical protein SAMN04488128_101241 [Chitinophaga eiseniae]|uniref:Uncharacterized protein n=1 Tax=Chitinophaga eiseniae TaxID=634771 RepID=A0A1T4KPT1_9BACT|nr:hypothetical protein [Chitinophaga eiseniae]SJZ44411.1 hypothetical protein SAMN04488128_101241 [Chitinophaga eiseniae]
MSLNFKLRLDELEENDPTKKQSAPPEDESYLTHSHVRNVNFVLLDGNMIFLNYGYLVSGCYQVQENRIILAFTSDKITLTGIYLKPLYYDLMLHLPRQIVAQDARYNAAAPKDTPIVNDITVKENG